MDYAQEVVDVINENFPDQFVFTFERDGRETRRVEAYIGKTLVYSRAKHGTYGDSLERKSKLWGRIQEALDKK